MSCFEDMHTLGTYLGIDEPVIMCCKESNPNLSMALYTMLYNLWYKLQDTDDGLNVVYFVKLRVIKMLGKII